MMPEVFVFSALFIFSIAFLFHMTLTLAGLNKAAVLRTFEGYAREDDSYYVLPRVLAVLGLFALSGGALLSLNITSRLTAPFPIPAIVLLVLAYVAHLNASAAKAHPDVFLSLPRWYARLRERSTRDERRRIAFMWLRLPPPMRRFYNVHDWAFLLWADLVILSLVVPEPGSA